EDHPAVVAAAVRPAAERDGLAEERGAQLAAIVGAHRAFVLQVLQRNGGNARRAPPRLRPPPGLYSPSAPPSRPSSGRCTRLLTKPFRYRPRDTSFHATMRVMRSTSTTGRKRLGRAATG